MSKARIVLKMSYVSWLVVAAAILDITQLSCYITSVIVARPGRLWYKLPLALQEGEKETHTSSVESVEKVIHSVLKTQPSLQ